MSEPVPTDQLSYRITVTSLADYLHVDGEPSSFATHIPLEVRQGDLVVARLHATLVHVDWAEREGIAVEDLFDSVDQDLHELYCAVYDAELGAIRGDLAEPSDRRDVLYIESAKVIPSRRGQKIALHAVARLRDRFGGGCAVLALKAHPLSAENTKYDDAINHEVFSKPFAASGDEAKKKLRTYWSQLGLAQVDHTDWMLFDMSEDRPAL